MEIGAINPFLNITKVRGRQQNPQIAPTRRVEVQSFENNPFSKFNDDGRVGLGIKDGAIQTSNGQMGKPVGTMREIGIA